MIIEVYFSGPFKLEDYLGSGAWINNAASRAKPMRDI